jgi:hypothetical protein
MAVKTTLQLSSCKLDLDMIWNIISHYGKSIPGSSGNGFYRKTFLKVSGKTSESIQLLSTSCDSCINKV